MDLQNRKQFAIIGQIVRNPPDARGAATAWCFASGSPPEATAVKAVPLRVLSKILTPCVDGMRWWRRRFVDSQLYFVESAPAGACPGFRSRIFQHDAPTRPALSLPTNSRKFAPSQAKITIHKFSLKLRHPTQIVYKNYPNLKPP
jgi:hypothetical protein